MTERNYRFVSSAAFIYTAWCLGVTLLAAPLSAAVIGFDGFDYEDGPVAGKNGGAGWDFLLNTEPGSTPQSASNWDNTGGEPRVREGMLITNGTSAKREFGGPTSGVVEGSNEREGAIRGEGVVYFSSNMSVSAIVADGAQQWLGMSSYEFGTEQLFFGVPSQRTAVRYFGLAGSALGATVLSTIPLEADVNYHLVGAIDFDADLVKLWINPNGSDFDDGGSHSADLAVSYTGSHWATAVRLASRTSFDTSWDNLLVANRFTNVVPEPTTTILISVALGLGVRTRRRLP